MNNAYKYNPTDFEGMMTLPEDLEIFYSAYEIYIKDKTDRNIFLHRKAWEFFLSVKHRGLEGFLTSTLQEDLCDYMMDLLEDAEC